MHDLLSIKKGIRNYYIQCKKDLPTARSIKVSKI